MDSRYIVTAFIPHQESRRVLGNYEGVEDFLLNKLPNTSIYIIYVYDSITESHFESGSKGLDSYLEVLKWIRYLEREI